MVDPIYTTPAGTNPSQHPLGAPTISGTTITVDTMLQQPTRITKMVMDLSRQRFIMDRLFSSGGGVTGGAVIYDQALDNEIYTNRDVERVAPGGEFPIVTSPRRAPKVAEVEKWGGKVFITDETRDRNDARAFVNEVRRLTNTIVRKLNQRAVATVEAAVASVGGATTIVGHNWATAQPYGSNPTLPGLTPHADFAAAGLFANVRELGFDYDTWLVNPQEEVALQLFYGKAYADVLRSFGIREVYATNRITAGTAYVVSSGNVGEMRIESPLGTETWRDPAGRQQTWTQASVRPLWFVQNPYAILKFTGLAG